MERLRNGDKFDAVAREMSEDKANRGKLFLIFQIPLRIARLGKGAQNDNQQRSMDVDMLTPFLFVYRRLPRVADQGQPGPRL